MTSGCCLIVPVELPKSPGSELIHVSHGQISKKPQGACLPDA